MPWPGAMIDGFVLAATVAGSGDDDPTAGLAREPREAARTELDRLRASNRKDVQRELRRMAEALVPTPDAGLPPRALALLAAEVRDERGARWLAEAPAPRRGYAAPAGLRAAVRLACRADDGRRVERELAELGETPWPG